MNPQMIRKIQQMQREIQQTQTEIEETEFTTSSGPVTVVMYGNHELKSVVIDSDFEVTGPDDLELLGDMIVAASHKANEEIANYTEEKLAKYKAFMGGF
ncbi:MAG: YbaB/EbfC family nucleoid-associated protein [Bacilli bacterium]|nr:YbaB/EbfC family nucleoid-associated protein [Bacilli bacterium]MDD7315138.1 YbaB/EbfC family nucleoid-associated protein [Bacilli bacterium]MDY4052674.1 YbaB/EbfC family nucleoid-associated protein [Bacilli bacterium]